MKKRILPLFIALFTLAFVACEKDEEQKELSKQEAKLALSAASVSVDSEMEEMQNHKALKSMQRLEDLDTPIGTDFLFFSTQQLKGNLNESPIAVFKANRKKTSGDQKTFADLVGTYTYNPTTENWDAQLADPNDKIILNFPTEGSTTNNATLTIHTWEQTEVTTKRDGITDTYFETSRFVADMTVDQEKVLDLNLNATWAENGEPKSIEYKLEVAPYTREISLSSTDGSAEFAVSFKKNEITLASFSITASMSEEGEPVKVSGHVQYGTIKIKGEVDMAGIMASISTASTPSKILEKMNENVNVEVLTYPENDKIGNIRIDLLEDQAELTPVIEFTDGSKEPAEEYLNSVIEQLQEFLKEFANNDDGDDLFSFKK